MRGQEVGEELTVAQLRVLQEFLQRKHMHICWPWIGAVAFKYIDISRVKAGTVYYSGGCFNHVVKTQTVAFEESCLWFYVFYLILHLFYCWPFPTKFKLISSLQGKLFCPLISAGYKKIKRLETYFELRSQWILVLPFTSEEVSVGLSQQLLDGLPFNLNNIPVSLSCTLRFVLNANVSMLTR